MLDSVGNMSQTPPLPTRSKGAKIVVVSAVSLAGVVLLGATFGAGYALQGTSILDIEAELAADQSAVAVSDTRAQPITAGQPIRVRTCSIDDLATNPALATFAGVVVDPQSGAVLFSRNEDTSVTPASILKILTATAALSALGPDTRFETKVVASSNPASVVLVAGGDATLSSLPAGAQSVYVGAPKLADLAEQTIAAFSEGLADGARVRITEVIVDASLWSSEDDWDESWKSDARANGFISQVTPLQIDGDRQNPSAPISRRGNDASDKAARAFVSALRTAGNTARFVAITEGTAEPGSRVLGSVLSQPVSELTSYMLKESDNTLAEMLARHVSLAVGLGGGSETLQEALAGTLASRGFGSDQVSIQDGSGLSSLNQVEPRYITNLLTEVYRSPPPLNLVRDGLSVAGTDGSLKDRFTAANNVAQGHVFAKTGSIEGVRSLAGFVAALDGTDLAFSFFSTGEVDDATKDAIETVVTGLYTCGENLANF